MARHALPVAIILLRVEATKRKRDLRLPESQDYLQSFALTRNKPG